MVSVRGQLAHCCCLCDKVKRHRQMDMIDHNCSPVMARKQTPYNLAFFPLVLIWWTFLRPTCHLTFYKICGKHQPHKVTTTSRKASMLCMSREYTVFWQETVAVVGRLSPFSTKDSNCWLCWDLSVSPSADLKGCFLLWDMSTVTSRRWEEKVTRGPALSWFCYEGKKKIMSCYSKTKAKKI